ncbi:hypothetical protein HOY82DRAFT_608913 [Tuber indicum]|nr:hypothetical protein HOY82DRAFT_608913 [Tuber indicum]
MFAQDVTTTRSFLHTFPRSPSATASKLRPVLTGGPGGLKVQQQQQRAVFMLPPPAYQYQKFRKGGQLDHRLWEDPNFRKFVGAVVFCGGTFYVYNIETVPVSRRRRFNFFSAEMEAQVAQQAGDLYAEVKESYRGQILPSYHPTTNYVKRVMHPWDNLQILPPLAVLPTSIVRMIGGRVGLVLVSGLEDLKWEVFVIKDNSTKNAFVIPGGKVFVFSDEDGLAAVMSHEIAHTVAHHASETMSKSFLTMAGFLLLSVVNGTDTSFLGNIMDLVYLRPGSRRQEVSCPHIAFFIDLRFAEVCPPKQFDLRKRHKPTSS